MEPMEPMKFFELLGEKCEKYTLSGCALLNDYFARKTKYYISSFAWSENDIIFDNGTVRIEKKEISDFDEIIDLLEKRNIEKLLKKNIFSKCVIFPFFEKSKQVVLIIYNSDINTDMTTTKSLLYSINHFIVHKYINDRRKVGYGWPDEEDFFEATMPKKLLILDEMLLVSNLIDVETICSLSTMKYEGSSNSACIEIYNSEIIKPDLKFHDKDRCLLYSGVNAGDKKVLNYRHIIKLCKMSNDKIRLCAINYNGQIEIIGINYSDKTISPECVLRFEGGCAWTICIGREIIRYAGGKVSMFCKEKEKGDYIVDTFLEKSMVKEIAENIKQQSHGTMVVFIEDDVLDSELERLCNVYRGIRTSTFDFAKVNKDIIMSLSSIDGAIVLDTKGNCHAIGVILDGVASVSTNRGRGARYNSALTYLAYMKEKQMNCAVLIVSEDGMVDYLDTNMNLNEKDISNELILERAYFQMLYEEYEERSNIKEFSNFHNGLY